MSRSQVLSLVFGATLLAGGAAAQEARPGIAVLPFDDGGSYGQDRENFAALEVGIQAVLIGELGRAGGVHLIGRSATREALRQQDLGVRGQVDAATAARVGRLAGARYVVFGSFIDLYGRFRLNARIVDVARGEILHVVSNDDPKLQDRRDLSRIIRAVAGTVLADIGVPAPERGDASPAVPTEALTLYSRGLLYEDRGEHAKAHQYFQRALDAFPAYAEAREGLRRVRAT